MAHLHSSPKESPRAKENVEYNVTMTVYCPCGSMLTAIDGNHGTLVCENPQCSHFAQVLKPHIMLTPAAAAGRAQ
jgi:hypothetical protein